MTNFFGSNIGADLSVLKKINVSVLILIFLYWSYGLFDDYRKETEAMELVLETDTGLDAIAKLETKINHPYVTVCDAWMNQWVLNKGVKRTVFHNWLDQSFNCTNNSPNYKDAIKACLEDSQENIIEALIGYSYVQDLPKAILQSSNTTTVLDKTSVWEKVFHDTFGICYTLDAKYWKRYCRLRLD